MNLETLKYLLEQWGTTGLFFGNILDCSFISFMGFMDYMFFLLCAGKPPFAILLNCIVATISAVAGMSLFYGVIWKTKERFFGRFLNKRSFSVIKDFVWNYEILFAIFIAFAPPPIPFKILLIACILFSRKFHNFLIGIIIGRFLRYFPQGFCYYLYGEEIKEVISSNYKILITLLLIAFILSFLVNKYIKDRIMILSEVHD